MDSHAHSAVENHRTASWMGFVGAGLGILCAIHCLVTPILIAVIPVVGGSWLGDENTELWLIGAAFVLAFGGTFWSIYKHGAYRVAGVFALAAVLVGLGQWAHNHEDLGTALNISGGLALAVVNLMSAKICQSCDTDSSCTHT